jgi:hypothetical protein
LPIGVQLAVSELLKLLGEWLEGSEGAAAEGDKADDENFQARLTKSKSTAGLVNQALKVRSCE